MDLTAYNEDLTIIVKGKKIPVWYYMENFLWVLNKDKGELVPFKLNEEQKLLYRDICIQKRQHRPIRQSILKARQLGMSTFIAGLYFSLGMNTPYAKFCVMADTEDHARNIFKIYKTFYDNLNRSLKDFEEIERYYRINKEFREDDMRPRLIVNTKGEMETETHGGLEVIVAGANAGRSTSYKGVHSSETAFQRNLLATNTALFQTVSMLDPSGMIFKETTANGYNDYKDDWDNDYNGYDTNQSLFQPQFYPWFKHSTYKMPIPTELGMPIMEEWLYEYQRKYNLSAEQIYWYWLKYCEIGKNKATMLQEYPFEPKDAFMSTAGACPFGIEKVEKRKDEVVNLPYERGDFKNNIEYSKDGSRIEISQIDFVKNETYGNWKIYQRPIKGHPYIVVCDPTKGFNADYTAMHVIDCSNDKQVAVYHSKEVGLDEVAKQIICAGYYYNTALISSENNTGTQVLDFAYKCDYPNIYLEQSNDLTGAIKQKLGHTTTKANRENMINDFVLAFNMDQTIINDFDTLCEMATFVPVKKSNGRVRLEAENKTCNDDLVMAFVAYFTVKQQQTRVVSEDNQKVINRPKTIDEIEEMIISQRKQAQVKTTNAFGIEF